MTICAAMLAKDGCWVGGDSRTIRANIKKNNVGPKFRRSAIGLVHGISGLEVAGDISEEVLKTYATASEVSVRQFCTDLRKAFVEIGWEGEKDGGFNTPGRCFYSLLTDGRSLFEIGADFNVRNVPLGEFVAIGSGGDIAYGAAFATRDRLYDSQTLAKSSVTVAVEACIEYDCGCGGRVDVMRVEPVKDLVLVP